MHERSTIFYVSRILTWFYGAYIIYTFSLRHLPEDVSEISRFLFLFFLNFGVQWGCYKLLALCNNEREEQAVFYMQITLISWAIYSYRFAYFKGMAYTPSVFFYLPLTHYGIVLVMFVILMIRNTRNHR